VGSAPTVPYRSPVPANAAGALSGTGEDKECRAMLDVFMLIIGVGFFALAVAYAFACERL
jgi:hypothetical protein